jgi:hypothetical protein
MMRQLWHDILTHRLVATLFALCWVGVWVMSVVMWTQGATGRLHQRACPNGAVEARGR